MENIRPQAHTRDKNNKVEEEKQLDLSPVLFGCVRILTEVSNLEGYMSPQFGRFLGLLLEETTLHIKPMWFYKLKLETTLVHCPPTHSALSPGWTPKGSVPFLNSSWTQLKTTSLDHAQETALAGALSPYSTI